jgi:hypothetical protein
VRIVTQDNVKLNGCEITNLQSPQIADKLEIRVIGNKDVTIGGTTDTYAKVYAPESDVKVHGTADFHGYVVGKTLRTIGTVELFGRRFPTRRQNLHNSARAVNITFAASQGCS